MILALTPHRNQARDWATEELADPKYREAQLSVFERITRAIRRFIDFLFDSATSHDSLPIFIISVIIIAAGVVWAVLRLRKGSGDAFDKALFSDSHLDSGLDPEQLRAQALTAADKGEFSAACQDMVRAIVAQLARTGVVDISAATTAGEVSQTAALTFPELAERLTAASQLFDYVSFGEYQANAEDFAQVLSLDADVQSAAAGRVAVA